MQAKLNALEAELATSRNSMRLGYTDPGSGEFVAASSVLLRNLARTSPDERLRRACYEVRCKDMTLCNASGLLRRLRGLQCCAIYHVSLFSSASYLIRHSNKERPCLHEQGTITHGLHQCAVQS